MRTALVALILCSCSAPTTTPACGVGDTRACLGPGACSGAQTCLADRSGFTTCDCGGAGGGSAGGGSAGGAAGGSGGGSAGGSAGGTAGGSAGGSAGGAAGGAQPPPTRLDLSVDRSIIDTELGKREALVLTLTPSNGFGGHVTLASTISGSSDAGFAGWTVAFDTTDVELDGGTAMVTARLTTATDVKDLRGTLNFTATSGAMSGDAGAEAAVTVLPQYTVSVAVTTQCVYPPAAIIPVRVGTKLRWLNTGPNAFNIHTDGTAFGCPHQDPSMQTLAGAVHECTTTAPGQIDWYCHSPGPNVPGMGFLVVP